MQRLVLFLCTNISNNPVTNFNYRKILPYYTCCFAGPWDLTNALSLDGIRSTLVAHFLTAGLMFWEGGSYCIILPFLSTDHSAPLRFIPTGILINKYSLQADTGPSQQNESSVSNVSTAGMKAHGGVAQSEASRQLIFPLWLAKLCCSYTNGNGMCMSVPPLLTLSLPLSPICQDNRF